MEVDPPAPFSPPGWLARVAEQVGGGGFVADYGEGRAPGGE